MNALKFRICRWVVTVALVGSLWEREVEAQAFAQQAAVAPAGDAVAVWALSMGNYNCVQAATMTSGGIWSSPPATLSALGESCSYPLVVADGSGNFIAIWSYYNTIDNVQALHASVRPVGGPWGPSIMISTNMENVADFEGNLENAAYQLRINSAGQAVAIWNSYIGNDLVIRASNYSSGTWATPTTLTP